MKIPDSVRIGGVEYEIQINDIVRIGTELCYGSIDYTESVIQLSEGDSKGHQHQCITLWHEILHGIFNHAGFKVENEEEIVEILSKGIYQVLQDNGKRLFDLKE